MNALPRFYFDLVRSLLHLCILGDTFLPHPVVIVRWLSALTFPVAAMIWSWKIYKAQKFCGISLQQEY